MTAVTIHHADREVVRIPEWVTDLEAFRRWARSDDFPERGWYSHLGGEIWVDLNMERLGHNQAKSEITIVVGALVRASGSGRFLADRMRFTNVGAGLSTEPDAMYFTYEAVRSGRVHWAEGNDSLEVEGSPDMVLEVISPSSEVKDTVTLRDLYWRAEVREYWLVDPRGDEPVFDILRHGPKGYVATRKQGGWLKSQVFGKTFGLTQQTDPTGEPMFTLAVR